VTRTRILSVGLSIYTSHTDILRHPNTMCSWPAHQYTTRAAQYTVSVYCSTWLYTLAQHRMVKLPGRSSAANVLT